MEKLPPLHILVVDDNQTNLQILEAFLTRLGHEIVMAENGEIAVAKFIEHQPDLILLDIMMPVMNGYEAARRIRAITQERWVPIIFLSALDSSQNLVEGLESGGDDYLTKPFNFVILEAKLRSMQRTLLLQEKAIESLKRTQVISDNLLDAIITIDHDGIIVSCNRATEYLFGWSPRELVGCNVNVLMPEPYASRHDGHIRAYVQGGPPQIIGIEREVPARRKDGSIFPAGLSVSEVRMERKRFFVGLLRDISERKEAEAKLRENAELLQRYYDETESENQLARSLIDRQLLRASLDDPRLHYWIEPAQNFSGDVVAAMRGKDGRLYALLADATGHGLTAAISTLPVLTMFYHLVPQCPPLAEMVALLNQQLRESVPVGRFLAATLLCLDEQTQQGEIWIGGTPDALLLNADGGIAERFISHQLPLGIVDQDDLCTQPRLFSWHADCQLLLHSDGFTEAQNRQGEQFGEDRLESVLHNVAPPRRRDALQGALARHLSGTPAQDDISLLLVDCLTVQSSQASVMAMV